MMERWPFELPQEPAATVSNNNTPHWTAIVETKPNVTLDLGTKLYTQEQVNACIAAALWWAAEQCVEVASAADAAPRYTLGACPSDHGDGIIDGAIATRDRIRAALPKDEAK